MLHLSNNIIYDHSHCQQCGACEAVCPKQAISFRRLADGTHQVVVDDEKCIRCKRCVNVCPANKREGFDGYFNGFEGKRYFLGYNKDNAIRRASSSGGVCKTIVIESLKNGLVDGVYTLRRRDKYPFAEGEFYTQENIPEYDDMPNSVYHSVLACQNITKVQKCKRLIIVGTACQLRAMNEALKGKADEIIRVCIFCKHRGEGWPGIVRVNNSSLSWNRAASIPFGKRLWTVAGCNSCGDPFGIHAEADISLMDPWKIRQSNVLGETLLTVHTQQGLDLLRNLPDIRLEIKQFEEICPALDLKDIWRKQQLVPFFRGENCNELITKAGKAEVRQRAFLRAIVETLPRMPMVFYRALCKFPDLRNKILK